MVAKRRPLGVGRRVGGVGSEQEEERVEKKEREWDGVNALVVAAASAAAAAVGDGPKATGRMERGVGLKGPGSKEHLATEQKTQQANQKRERSTKQ